MKLCYNQAAGYDGMVSVETFRPEYWEQAPEWIIPEACRTTRQIIEKHLGHL